MTGGVEKKIDGLAVNNEDEEDDVNPWDVRAKDEKGIDYDKLISKLCSVSRISSGAFTLQLLSFREVRELQDRPGVTRPNREGDGEARSPSPEARGLLLSPGYAYHPQRR